MNSETQNLFYKNVDVYYFPLPFNLENIIPIIFLVYLILFLVAIFIKKLRHIKLRYMAIILFALLIVSVMANFVQPTRKYNADNWQKNICFDTIEVPYPYELDKNEQFILHPFTFNKLTSSKNKWFFVQEVINIPKDVSLETFCKNWAETIKKNTGFDFQKNLFKSVNLNGFKVDYLMNDKHIFTSDFMFQINNKFYIVTCNEQDYCFDEGIAYALSQVRKL